MFPLSFAFGLVPVSNGSKSEQNVSKLEVQFLYVSDSHEAVSMMLTSNCSVSKKTGLATRVDNMQLETARAQTRPQFVNPRTYTCKGEIFRIIPSPRSVMIFQIQRFSGANRNRLRSRRSTFAMIKREYGPESDLVTAIGL